jgi:hypothetical protein
MVWRKKEEMQMVKENELMRVHFSDWVYEALRERAKKNKRSLSGEFEAIIQLQLGLPIERSRMRIQFILEADKEKKIPVRIASA